jgi:hypothetical protein
MAGEASGAFGELFEILDGSPTEIVLSETPDTYAKWVTASPGLMSPTGLVLFESGALDTWGAAIGYPTGAKVAHSGRDWIATDLEYAAYDPETTYSATDTCSYGGYDWVCILESTANPPEADSLYWEVENLAEEPAAESTFWTDAGERGDRLVIQEGGYGTYRIFAAISSESDPPGAFTWAVHKNDELVLQMLASAVAVAGIRYPMTATGLIKLSPGDYVELGVSGSEGSETITLHCVSFSLERIYED